MPGPLVLVRPWCVVLRAGASADQGPRTKDQGPRTDQGRRRTNTKNHAPRTVLAYSPAGFGVSRAGPVCTLIAASFDAAGWIPAATIRSRTKATVSGPGLPPTRAPVPSSATPVFRAPSSTGQPLLGAGIEPAAACRQVADHLVPAGEGGAVERGLAPVVHRVQVRALLVQQLDDRMGVVQAAVVRRVALLRDRVFDAGRRTSAPWCRRTAPARRRRRG